MANQSLQTSHHKLLSAFVDEQALTKMDQTLQRRGYRTHEFGDSVLIEKSLCIPPGPPARFVAEQRPDVVGIS